MSRPWLGRESQCGATWRVCSGDIMCYNLARLDADVRTIINQKQNTKASPAPGSARKSHTAGRESPRLRGRVPAAGILAALATLILSGLAARAQPAVNALSSSIAVSGNHLVDSSGQIVSLRGVDLSGTEFTCAQGWDGVYGGQPLNDAATYAAMQTWGINVVRIPLNEDCWLAINGVKATVAGAAYQEAIRIEVNFIRRAGMYVILDLHWSAPGGQLALSQNPAPDEDHSVEFWRQLAGSYRSDTGLIFDIFNEPYDYWGKNSDHWAAWLNGDTYSQWVTGGSPYTIAAPWRSAGVQQLVNAIRGTGAKQPIILNGLDWANDLSGWLTHVPHDPLDQLVAGWHAYSGQGCSSRPCWDRVIAPIALRFPLIVGETGDFSSGTETFLPTFLPWADQHGLSYLAWTWNPWQDATNVLIKDWSGSPTDGEGVFYKEHLALPPQPTGLGPVAKSSTTRGPGSEWIIVVTALLCLLAAAGALIAGRRRATSNSVVAGTNVPNETPKG